MFQEMDSQFKFNQSFVPPGSIVGGYPPNVSDGYGRMSVSSINGNFVFISAPTRTILGFAKAGIVYIYGTTDNWASAPTLLNTITEVSPAANRQWGSSISSSDDGFTLAVFTVSPIEAYIVRPSVAGDWTSTPIITKYDSNTPSGASFGTISGDGNLAITSQHTFVDLSTRGRVKLFKSPYTGTPFVTIGNPDGLSNINFAFNAQLSRDGIRILASAPNKGTGSIFIFTATDTTWTSYSVIEIVNPTGLTNMGLFLASSNFQMSRFVVGFQTGTIVSYYLFY